MIENNTGNAETFHYSIAIQKYLVGRLGFNRAFNTIQVITHF